MPAAGRISRPPRSFSFILMQLESRRAMRALYPEDLDLRDRIFAAWTDASTMHGFQRFEPPVVESFELLARKAGEEVAQQIYHFEDKSNRQLALRPEVTPSLVRMISARPQQILFPAKRSEEHTSELQS